MVERRIITEYLKIVAKGFCMGTADVIPGVSGGTIAFLLGIYERLIQAIKSFDVEFFLLLVRFKFVEAFRRTEWKFLGALLFGIAVAILSLAHVLSWLLVNKPVLIQSFFFGLILATVPLIGRIIKAWSVGSVIAVILSGLITFYVVSMVPAETPRTPLMIFLSGALAISAMILPGISGAFILVLIGKYHFILDAINHRDILVLGIFICGIVVGIVTFVRVLGWLFNKWHDITISALTGIIIGSLNKIWPWKETLRSIESSHGKLIPVEQINFIPKQMTSEVVWAVILIVVGFLIAFLLDKSSENGKGISVN